MPTPTQLLTNLGKAPERAADVFAVTVRRTPSKRLEQFMSTPLRRIVLDTIFWQMPRQLDRRRARGVQASARWKITTRGGELADVYDLIVADGRCQVRRGGRPERPRVTITVDGARFLRIVTGAEDPMKAYFKGELAISGDIMTAARLVSLFRVPGAARSSRGG